MRSRFCPSKVAIPKRRRRSSTDFKVCPWRIFDQISEDSTRIHENVYVTMVSAIWSEEDFYAEPHCFVSRMSHVKKISGYYNGSYEHHSIEYLVHNFMSSLRCVYEWIFLKHSFKLFHNQFERIASATPKRHESLPTTSVAQCVPGTVSATTKKSANTSPVFCRRCRKPKHGSRIPKPENSSPASLPVASSGDYICCCNSKQANSWQSHHYRLLLRLRIARRVA